MSYVFTARGLHIDGTIFPTPREALVELERGALLVDIREPHEIYGAHRHRRTGGGHPQVPARGRG